jgi:hypothetical protein
MALWRKRLFLAISANSAITADAYFNLPRDHTLIVGPRVEL